MPAQKMTITLAIILILHSMVCGFLTGIYHQDQATWNNIPVLLLHWLIILFGWCFAIEVCLLLFLWYAGKYLLNELAGITQIVHYYHIYISKKYRKLDDATLEFIDNRIEYFMSLKRLNLAQKHFRHVANIINKFHNREWKSKETWKREDVAKRLNEHNKEAYASWGDHQLKEVMIHECGAVQYPPGHKWEFGGTNCNWCGKEKTPQNTFDWVTAKQNEAIDFIIKQINKL